MWPFLSKDLDQMFREANCLNKVSPGLLCTQGAVHKGKLGRQTQLSASLLSLISRVLQTVYSPLGWIFDPLLHQPSSHHAAVAESRSETNW